MPKTESYHVVQTNTLDAGQATVVVTPETAEMALDMMPDYFSKVPGEAPGGCNFLVFRDPNTKGPLDA